MAKLSLVLVTVDCLRADHAGFLGYARPTTPFLNELAAESMVFPRAIVAGVPTYFSFPGIMASRFPLGLGREVPGLAPGEPTLASILQSRGWTTAGFVAGNPYLTSHFGYDQGFDKFKDFLWEGSSSPQFAGPSSWIARLNRALDKVSRVSDISASLYQELYFRYCQWQARSATVTMDSLRPYPSADVVVDQARSWLKAQSDQPFFLWLHLMDPHHPYYPPEKALRFFDDGITARRAGFLNSYWNRSLPERRLRRYRDQVLSLYDAGIRWVDTQLARLVETLQQFGRWNETVFALTADHGEEFLEHQRKYHSPVALSEELTHVPLLLRAPGVAAAMLPDTPFSLLDLAPTLLDVLSVESPTAFTGQSGWPQILNQELPQRPVFTECIDGCTNSSRVEDCLRPRILAVTEGAYKLVMRFADQREHLYDLSRDPHELSPVPASENVAVRRRLLEHARCHLRARHSDSESRLRARVRDFRRGAEPVPLSVPVEQA
jgi:arylsulfatase A-like enzyme